MPDDNKTSTTDGHPWKRSHRLRLAAAILVLLLVAAYATAVIAGLPKERRIDAATLGILGMGIVIAAVLFRPDILGRVTRLEVAGWKIDIEKRQEKADRELTYLRLMLPVLLPDAERKHLLNLAEGNTRNYKGSHEVRSELRRLRSLGLIRMQSGKTVGDIRDNSTVDIGEYVELTERGRESIKLIQEIETGATGY